MATIKHVAERAGVSTATVSYVLNGTGTITPATRQRVLAAVADLNYQPNYAARSLRSRSRTLGLVLPAHAAALGAPARAEILAGLAERAATAGYYLLLAHANDDQDEALLAEQLVRTGRVEGIALLDTRTDDERVRLLDSQAIPLVYAGPPLSGVTSPFVAVDGRHGAQAAVRYLLSLGHRAIGLIMLPLELAASEAYYDGYVDALATIGSEPDPTLIITAGLSRADGTTAMQELLALPAPPTAVLACNDELAFGAMHAISEAGLTVGRAISLVGIDDLPASAYTIPPLTTLHYPRHTIGSELARLLIAQIEQPQPGCGVTLQMQLMIRRSASRV